jgi:hypothetical protein
LIGVTTGVYLHQLGYTFMVQFAGCIASLVAVSLVAVIMDLFGEYSNPPNTEPSGIQMVIFQTLLGSGFQMVVMTASLDRLIKKRVIKNILFMPKWSRLVPTIRKPDKKSGF